MAPFCLLPRHVNFVTALRAGVSSFTDDGNREQFVGHSSGLLVKSAANLRIVVANGVIGDDLPELKEVVAEHFTQTDERERQAISTIARLEAEFCAAISRFGATTKCVAGLRNPSNV